MPLVNAIDLVREASAKNAAVLAFVCIDYNEARAVVNAAEQTGKPAVIMLLPEYVTKYSLNGFGEFAAMVKFMAEHTDARIGLHLDHSYDEAEARRAIACGFTSIMFDASRDDLETNIRRTRAMVEYAHARGVAVESELGSVGLASERWGEKTDLFTKPDAVALFCRETGVDSLAVAIGNAHGDYLQTPNLDLVRLDEIDAATDTPLVLHGGSGIQVQLRYRCEALLHRGDPRLHGAARAAPKPGCSGHPLRCPAGHDRTHRPQAVAVAPIGHL